MNASHLNRLVVRASSAALALTFAHATVATAQTPTGVRCADGFVATTVAICNKGHQGLSKAGARSTGQLKTDTTQLSGTQGGLADDSAVTEYRQGTSAGPAERSLPPANSNPWPAVPTRTGIVPWPATGTGGNSAGSSSPIIQLPPGVVIPPPSDSQTKQQQKPKSP
jgi:hypothetical protein